VVGVVLFAGGAGIALSRAAVQKVLPLLAGCEAEYTWDWPGDVRVAQCLLDAGIEVRINPHIYRCIDIYRYIYIYIYIDI